MTTHSNLGFFVSARHWRYWVRPSNLLKGIQIGQREQCFPNGRQFDLIYQFTKVYTMCQEMRGESDKPAHIPSARRVHAVNLWSSCKRF